MKKLFALMLAFCLMLNLVPAPAFAEGEPVCTCETACTEENKNTACPVCGAEGATLESCGKYVTPEPTATQKVQTLINALPDTVTAENRAEVEAQLTAIDNAKLPLSDEERDTLDFTRYDAAIAAINVLDNQPGAEKPEGMNAYMITLDANGGAFEDGETSTIYMTDPDGKFSYISLPIPTQDGYNFTGWYTAAEGGDPVTKDTVFTSVDTIYAHWTLATALPSTGFTITFDPKGGTLPEGTKNPATTNAEGKLDSLPTPARDGYEFHYWYTGDRATGEVTTASVFTEDTTVYAWFGKTIDTANISLSGYGNGLPVSGLKLTWDESNGSVENYYISSDKDGKNKVETTHEFTREETYYLNLEITLKEDIDRITNFTLNGAATSPWLTQDGRKVTAVFQLPTAGYVITLDPNGGTISSTTFTTNAAGKLTPWPKATRDGYVSDGWYTQPTGGESINTEYVFTENTTLYAHWLEVIPEIGFSMSGYGNGQTISDLKLTLDKGNEGVASDYGQYGVNYFISLERWGDPIDSSEKFSGEKTYYLRVKVEPKEGYRAGRDGNFTLNGNGHEVYTMESYVYTVVFQLPTVGYVITFDPNGGQLKDTETTASTTNGKLTNLPTPTRDGYLFAGWYTEKDSGDKVDTDTNYSANTTLYAHWTANTYTVHFDANGGEGTMADQAMTCDKSESLKANAFALEGHIFRGWNTEPDGTGTSYADGETVQNLTTEKDTVVTLFAQWELIVNEVNLTLSGHELDKRVNGVKVTSEDNISFGGAAYGSAWGIATNKNTLKTLDGKLFQADTQYYLWVTFSPEEGCTLEGLSAKDVRLDGTAAFSLTLNSGLTEDGEQKPETATAVFRLPVIYTITVNAGKNGSVSSDSTINTKGVITVFEGEDVTIKITPDKDYVVYRLTVDGTSVKTARTYTFENIQQSHTLRARFLKNGTNAKTGDSFPLVPAIAVLTLSAAALVAVVVIAKKKKKK